MDENPDWRHGQAFFNALYSIRPELADKVRGTTIDTFHLDKNIPSCIEFIRTNA